MFRKTQLCEQLLIDKLFSSLMFSKLFIGLFM